MMRFQKLIRMNRLVSLLLLFALASCSSLNELNEVLQPVTGSAGNTSLSRDEVVRGLKEALERGTRVAVSTAGVQDGFYRNPQLYIPFPEEAQKVKETAVQYGLGGQVERFEENLNRAAEEAAAKATPIFLEAIRGMSIQDAFGILNGADNAATEYLREQTGSALAAEFRPVVREAIDKVELTRYWEPMITKYNAVNFLTGGDDIDPDLEAYVTQRAIEGLFVHVASEEKKIRTNPSARVTELLQKVFGS